MLAFCKQTVNALAEHRLGGWAPTALTEHRPRLSIDRPGAPRLSIQWPEHTGAGSCTALCKDGAVLELAALVETAAALFDSEGWIRAAGDWALLLVCAIVFVETGLLIGFLLPGDTLLLITGVLVYTGVITQPIWLVCLCIFIAAVLGDQLGYLIGLRGGPAVFARRQSGFFSLATMERTERFFERWGGWAVTIARFVAFVRTFAPVAAGIGRMHYARFLFFNVLGGLIWGAGLPLAGWGFAHLPGVAELVTQYIDVVLIGVIALAAITVLIHYLHTRQRGRALAAEQAAEQTLAAEATAGSEGR